MNIITFNDFNFVAKIFDTTSRIRLCDQILQHYTLYNGAIGPMALINTNVINIETD